MRIKNCIILVLGIVVLDKKVCVFGEVENQEKFDSLILDLRNFIDGK